LAQLAAGAAEPENLLETLVDQAKPGVADLAADRQALAGPAADRLAFRELGLAIEHILAQADQLRHGDFEGLHHFPGAEPGEILNHVASLRPSPSCWEFVEHRKTRPRSLIRRAFRSCIEEQRG
jgi:hypothetical protein